MTEQEFMLNRLDEAHRQYAEACQDSRQTRRIMKSLIYEHGLSYDDERIKELEKIKSSEESAAKVAERELEKGHREYKKVVRRGRVSKPRPKP